MPAPSDRAYWRQRAYDLDFLSNQMSSLAPSDPRNSELDRKRREIMDEADRAGVYLPDYK
jgi:hypothetical protein